jgi:hypothetical protein
VTQQPYRVLVTGSRDWDDIERVRHELNRIYDQLAATRLMVVVHGVCPTGADRHARHWVRDRQHFGEPVVEDPHRAEAFGPWPACGPKRNAHMVQLGADACLAFIGPCTSPRCRRPEPHPSHGASGCAALAEQAGIPTRRWTA